MCAGIFISAIFFIQLDVDHSQLPGTPTEHTKGRVTSEEIMLHMYKRCVCVCVCVSGEFYPVTATFCLNVREQYSYILDKLLDISSFYLVVS